MDDFKLQSINWRDGMLLTMEHFRKQQQYFEELLRWHAVGTGDNYGLVRKHKDRAPLQLDSKISGGRLKVEVWGCQAVLPGGAFVEFNGSMSGGEVLKSEIEFDEDPVPVYICLVQDRKKQVGDPDPREEIPRIPYEIPEYSIVLGEAPNLPASMYVQAALLKVDGSGVSMADGYFPPCISVDADERLHGKIKEYRKQLEGLLRSSIEAALTNSGPDRLQRAYREMSGFLVHQLSSGLDDFAVGAHTHHPRRYVVMIKGLLRTVSSMLKAQNELKDSINDEFFAKKGGTNLDIFLSTIDKYLDSSYDHEDIAGQTRVIDEILRTLGEMIESIAGSEAREEIPNILSYQGKTYTKQVFSGITVDEVGEWTNVVIDMEEPFDMKGVVVLIKRALFTDNQWLHMESYMGMNEVRDPGNSYTTKRDLNTRAKEIVLWSEDQFFQETVNRITLILRGISDTRQLEDLGSRDVIIYAF